MPAFETYFEQYEHEDNLKMMEMEERQKERMDALKSKLDQRWVIIDGRDTFPPAKMLVMVKRENSLEAIDYRKDEESILYPFANCDDVIAWRRLDENELKDILRNQRIADSIKWIPCEVKLPPQPIQNPKLDNKPLELYQVYVKNADYPFRAFWNGKDFTDGWKKLEVMAWQPLPPLPRT